MSQLTKNFSVKELACGCCGRCEMQPEFMAKLQEYRDRLSFAINIASGYRCPKHNKAVGGAPGSKHLKGFAADPVLRADKRHLMIKTAFDVGFSGIGIGKRQFHVDNRPGLSVCWSY